MDGYTVDQLVSLAKCCEITERYDEMKEAMKKVVEMKTTVLNIDERNLLSVAYKNIVGLRRSAWRSLLKLHSDITVQTKNTKEYDETVVSNLIAKVFEELKTFANEIVGLLDAHILEHALYQGTDTESCENKVFFYKMKGDYLRYIAEALVNDRDQRKEYTDLAAKAYSHAQQIADEHLAKNSSIRLGLILNFSVFYYEIAEDTKKAIELAKMAFDNVVDSNEDCDSRDSTLILQLLRDNLSLWKGEPEDDEDEDDD